MEKQAAQARIDQARSVLRAALVEMARASSGLPARPTLTMIPAAEAEPEVHMAKEDEDAAQKAYRDGLRTGINMASTTVLEVLLQHILATAEDPAALREQLRAEALRQARGLNDGTGRSSPFIEGVRAGAVERVIGFFGPDAPISRQ
jgi:hypothetical protein